LPETPRGNKLLFTLTTEKQRIKLRSDFSSVNSFIGAEQCTSLGFTEVEKSDNRLFQMNGEEFHFRAIAEEMLAQWQVVADGSPVATFYHSAEWFRALRKIEPRARLIGCFRENQLIGGCVLRVWKRLGITEAHKPWATFYNGPIFSPALSPEDMHTALRAFLDYLRRSYDSVRLVFPPDAAAEPLHHLKVINYEQLRRETAWNIVRDHSYSVDVSDIDRLWERLERHARQRMRKATRLGVYCEPLEDWQTFYRLYRATYERQGLPFHITEEAFAGFFSEILCSKNARAFLARTEEGKPAAALLVGWRDPACRGKQRSYFVLAASETELRHTDAATLLWWETFEWCAVRSREIDLVGRATPGIDRFKRSFSPTELPYFELSCSPRGLRGIHYRLVQRLRSLAR
jgi:hypothetical protein